MARKKKISKIEETLNNCIWGKGYVSIKVKHNDLEKYIIQHIKKVEEIPLEVFYFENKNEVLINESEYITLINTKQINLKDDCTDEDEFGNLFKIDYTFFIEDLAQLAHKRFSKALESYRIFF